WNGGRSPFRRVRGSVTAARRNHCCLANQVGCQHRQATQIVLGPAEFDRNILPFDIADFLQTLPEGGHHRRVGPRQTAAQKPHHWHRRLLRPRRERPRDRRAEERDELAALHSITSSAVNKRFGGIVRPSALAVLRLITSSYLVGCWKGRSPAFSPRRMRST